VRPPEEVHIEGEEDVMLWNDHIAEVPTREVITKLHYLGQTSGVQYIKDLFQNKL
jgi:hypothetical protein